MAGGIGSGIRQAGDAIARGILERRRQQRDDAQRAAEEARWQAEMGLRERRLAIEEQAADRARQDADLLAGLPDDLGTLASGLEGREYGGIPYQVPASEMGPGEAGAEFPTTEGPRLEAQPFTRPYASTREMLREHPGAARAASNVMRATRRPALGPGSATGLRTVEQTQAELDRQARHEGARAKKTEAVSMLASKDPADRGAGLQLMVKAWIDEEKMGPSELKTVMELQASERGREENDEFLQAARPFWSTFATGAALSPEAQVDFAKLIYEHRRSPLVKHYAEEIMGAMAASESPVGKAAFRITQLRMAGVSGEDAFAQVFGENPTGLAGMVALGKLPEFLKRDIEAHAKEAGKSETEKAIEQARLARERAGTEESKARKGEIEARTKGRSPGAAKTVGEAQLNLQRARTALRELDAYEGRRGIDEEDLPGEKAARRADVEFWQSELQRLRGSGGMAEDPGEKTSAKGWGALTPEQQKIRVAKVIRRLKNQGKIRRPMPEVTEFPQLTEAEKALVAAELQQAPSP